MLTSAIIIVILGAVWFAVRLWSIRKHDRVLHTMYDYRREIMSLMRTDRFEQVETEDYLTLRKTLDNANLVSEDFEKTDPNVFSFVHLF